MWIWYLSCQTKLCARDLLRNLPNMVVFLTFQNGYNASSSSAAVIFEPLFSKFSAVKNC
jgi:hypothetical protein